MSADSAARESNRQPLLSGPAKRGDDKEVERLLFDLATNGPSLSTEITEAVSSPSTTIVNTGGGGGVFVGTVVAFDPTTQVAQVSVAGQGTVSMANHATFQLVPGDVVTCAADVGGSVSYIIGLIRQPDYVPPSWAIPVVSADFPLQVDGLAIPMDATSTSGQEGFVIDATNELGFGAGSVVGRGADPAAGVVVLTPGANSLVSLPVTSAPAGYSLGRAMAIFDGKLIVNAGSTHRGVHIWDSATGLWTQDVAFGEGSEARFATHNGVLWCCRNTASSTNPSTDQAQVLRMNPGDSGFTLVSGGGSRFQTIQPMIANGFIWWSASGNLRGSSLAAFTSLSSSEVSIPAPTGASPTSASASFDGDYWDLYQDANGDLTLLRVAYQSGAVQVWPVVFDPLDRPTGQPNVVARPNGGLYAAGAYTYEDAGVVYSFPAIWSIDPAATQDNTTRIWTGDASATIGIWFGDVNTLRWTLWGGFADLFFEAVL